MEVNPQDTTNGIFRQYDIRGVYPEEIYADIVRRIANATGRFLKAEKVVVGEDARVSSPELSRAVIEGLNSAGIDVLRIGISTTPLFYFSVNNLKVDGGIMITASHGPAKYNGLKIMGMGGQAVSLDSGLKEIQTLSDSIFSGSRRGGVENISTLDRYVDFLIKNSAVDTKKLAKIKFVADASNGTVPVVLKELCGRLGLGPILINSDIDGRFPNHSPDTSKPENLLQLKKKVAEVGAGVGFAFDGDADRLSVIDENGIKIGSDFIAGLLFESKSSFFKKPKIVYDLRFSRSIKDLAGKNGRPSRTGYPFIRAKMREFEAGIGAELSGHFSFKELNYAESAVLTMLYILKALANSGKKMSELVKPFEKYFNSGEINFELQNADDKARIFEKLKEKYKDGSLNETDGILIDYKDWWFSLRPSNTEPLMRLVVEAKTGDLMERKAAELRGFIEAPFYS